MAQMIKQGNIFGRIGSGLGKGLAEQLPKEVERSRLASSLRDIGQNKDLNQFERFAALASAPGSTPQIVHSGTELLKQQQIKEAYRRGSGIGTQRNEQGYGVEQQGSPNIRDIRFGQFPDQPRSQNSGETIPTYSSTEDKVRANPGAANENPLEEKFIPPNPWNQNMQESAINEAFDRGIATNFDEANGYANQQKKIYEDAPEAYRKQLEYKRGVDQNVDQLFDKQLQTRLQKEGNETYKDATGDFQLKLKKQARNAVATGKMNEEQAAEFYSNKALELAKAKNRVLEIANRDIWDRITPTRKEENLKNLMHLAKTFSDSDSSQELFDLLRTDTSNKEAIGLQDILPIGQASSRQNGLGLSAGGAAIIAFRPSKAESNLIKSTSIGAKNPVQQTKSFAEEVLKNLTPKDSFLSIARNMKQKDPNFDENAFFDYLRDNSERYSSDPRLTLEVSRGVSDFFPNWRDIGLFPVWGKAVTNE